MPGTYNGFGTSYVGATSRGTDRSFVTTEWVVVLLLPILPRRSFRVIYHGETETRQLFSQSRRREYSVLSQVPLNIPQVVVTYIIVLAQLAILAGVLWLWISIIASGVESGGIAILIGLAIWAAVLGGGTYIHKAE